MRLFLHRALWATPGKVLTENTPESKPSLRAEICCVCLTNVGEFALQTALPSDTQNARSEAPERRFWSRGSARCALGAPEAAHGARARRPAAHRKAVTHRGLGTRGGREPVAQDTRRRLRPRPPRGRRPTRPATLVPSGPAPRGPRLASPVHLLHPEFRDALASFSHPCPCPRALDDSFSGAHDVV